MTDRAAHRPHLGRRKCPTCSEERDRGVVLAVVALALVTLITMAAMTVDLGRLMIKRRDLQSLAEVVSLDMIRSVDGRTRSALEADPVWNSALISSVQRNASTSGTSSTPTATGTGVVTAGSTTITAVLGSVNASTRVFTASAAGDTPTAVKITAAGSIPYYFAQVVGASSGSTSRSATAAQVPKVKYQLGSFLVGVNPTAPQVTLLNKVLGKSLGGSDLGLTAVSYQGLANANVTLRQISTQMGLASPDQLFSGTVNARNFFNAAADVAQANGASAATVSAARVFATTVSGSTQFDLNSVVDHVGSVSAASGHGAVADASMSLFGILQGSTSVINGSNVLSIPALSLSIPNLGSVDLTLKVIESAQFSDWVSMADVNAGYRLRTSQVDIGLTAAIDLDVSLLLGLTQAHVRGSVTVKPSVAGANAAPTSITCGAGAGTTIGLAADPVSVIASEDLILSAKLLIIPIDLLHTTVTNASVSTSSSGGSASYAYNSEFMPPVGPGTAKRIGSTTFNLAGGLNATSSNSTLLGGTLPLGTLLGNLNTVLTSSIYPSLTNNLIPLVTNTLGIELGGGDVGADNLSCGSPNLVG